MHLIWASKSNQQFKQCRYQQKNQASYLLELGMEARPRGHLANYLHFQNDFAAVPGLSRESLTLAQAEPVFWWWSENGCMHDRRFLDTGMSAVLLFGRSKCRMLRFHAETPVFPFQSLYFGRVLQSKGKHCLPKSLRKHQL